MSIHDGETMKVKRGFEEKTIRFCGINAPELSQPLDPQSKANLQ